MFTQPFIYYRKLKKKQLVYEQMLLHFQGQCAPHCRGAERGGKLQEVFRVYSYHNTVISFIPTEKKRFPVKCIITPQIKCFKLQHKITFETG